jgi:hypothetical protein
MSEVKLSDAQIKHMVDRFLMWKLPADFAPDAGISYKRPNYDQSWSPVGTNLLDATQAEAMVRHMVEGLAESPSAAEAVKREREACAKIAEGEVVFEHYRRWPCWQPHGDRSKEWEGTQLADAIAAAIRKGAPDPRDATIASQRALLEKAAEGLGDAKIVLDNYRGMIWHSYLVRPPSHPRFGRLTEEGDERIAPVDHALAQVNKALDEIAAALGKGGKGERG